jgi:hypothetical protein
MPGRAMHIWQIGTNLADHPPHHCPCITRVVDGYMGKDEQGYMMKVQIKMEEN